MVALSDYQWTIIGVAGVGYLFVCVRTARTMARTGRSFWKWLLITVFCTSIPATILLLREQARRVRGGRSSRRRPRGSAPPLRCPHCGDLIRREDLDSSGGAAACPSCGMVIDDTEVG